MSEIKTSINLSVYLLIHHPPKKKGKGGGGGGGGGNYVGQCKLHSDPPKLRQYLDWE